MADAYLSVRKHTLNEVAMKAAKPAAQEPDGLSKTPLVTAFLVVHPKVTPKAARNHVAWRFWFRPACARDSAVDVVTPRCTNVFMFSTVRSFDSIPAFDSTS